MKKLFMPLKEFYEEIVAAGRSGGNHGKGLKCMKVGDYASAVQYFQMALEDSENADNPTMIPYELEAIANAHFMLEDFDQAEHYAQKSLKLYEQIEHLGDLVKDRILRLRDLLDLLDAEEK